MTNSVMDIFACLFRDPTPCVCFLCLCEREEEGRVLLLHDLSSAAGHVLAGRVCAGDRSPTACSAALPGAAELLHGSAGMGGEPGAVHRAPAKVPFTTYMGPLTHHSTRLDGQKNDSGII